MRNRYLGNYQKTAEKSFTPFNGDAKNEIMGPSGLPPHALKCSERQKLPRFLTLHVSNYTFLPKKKSPILARPHMSHGNLTKKTTLCNIAQCSLKV